VIKIIPKSFPKTFVIFPKTKVGDGLFPKANGIQAFWGEISSQKHTFGNILCF